MSEHGACDGILLLWGTPTLTLGLGISSGEVGTVLTIFAVATVITGPLSGIVSSRLGTRRGRLVLSRR